MSTKKLTYMAVLTSVALAVYVIENMLPPLAPIPAVRFGLSNTVTLFVLYLGGKWKTRDAALLLVGRVLLGALVTGTTMTLLFSVVGGAFSIITMAVFKILLKKDRSFIWITSVFGALFHIAGQLLSAVLIYGGSVLFYSPILIISAILSGFFTGIIVTLVFKKMIKICNLLENA